jgi:beta-glucanase (GH16 family)
MKNGFQLVALVAIVWCCIAAAKDAAPPTLEGRSFLTVPGDQWKLLWHDEFSGDHLDSSKWTIGLAWQGDDGIRHHNWEYSSYIMDDDVIVHNGMLDLLTEKRDVKSPIRIYHYTEGFIQTDGKFQYRYGYCEIRARCPVEAGKGMWPAFWLQDHTWPPEDDVAEFWTGRPLPHLHQGYAFRNASGEVTWESRHRNEIPTGFHTYGMEWGPGYQIMNMDGKPTLKLHGYEIVDRPMYIMLNSGVAYKFPPDEKTVFPNSFLVDYVRVYSRPPVIPLIDGGFEDDSLDPWWQTKGEAKIVSDHSLSGRQALRLTGTASAEQRVYGLKLNTAYRLTAWANAGDGKVSLGVKDYGGPERSVSQSGSGYQKMTLDFSTNPYHGSVVVYCGKSGAGEGYWDDVEIVELLR